VIITKEHIDYILHSPNTSGGGGNIEKLKALRGEEWRLVRTCEKRAALISRLGKQGARANNREDLSDLAYETLLKHLEKEYGEVEALIPPEGVGGQLARTLAACQILEKDVFDADLSGGLGIPSLSLAVPQVDELIKQKQTFYYAYYNEDEEIEVRKGQAHSSAEMEQILRERAANNYWEAVWFALPALKCSEVRRYFSLYTVSNTISRGFTLKCCGYNALENAQVLQNVTVEKVKDINWTGLNGFTEKIIEFSHDITIKVMNEFVVLEAKRSFRSPTIIAFVDERPIQSQEIREGMEGAIVLLPAWESKNAEFLNKHRNFWKKINVKGEVLSLHVH
jgi:DUF917 family protein